MYRNYWQEWKDRQSEAEHGARLEAEAMTDPAAEWAVVRNGRIIFKGTESECTAIIADDMVGDLEMYPMAAYNR